MFQSSTVSVTTVASCQKTKGLKARDLKRPTLRCQHLNHSGKRLLNTDKFETYCKHAQTYTYIKSYIIVTQFIVFKNKASEL